MRYALLQPSWLAGKQRPIELTSAVAVGLRDADREWIATSLPLAAITEAECVIVWGLGHPKGQQLIRDANARGVHVVGFDLGYWKRTGPDPRYRFSVDGAHPQKYVMAKDRPMDRFLDDAILLREDADPDGPVVLVGMGWKSADTYGERAGEWESKAVSMIRRTWPGKRIVFRPKAGGGDHVPMGVTNVERGGSIEAVLKGASAVVCRHSNVAVDAIIAGVPATAEDGAASAVLSPLGSGPPRLLQKETRTRFLSNLAWHQWSMKELRRAETWIVVEDIIRSAV